MSKTIAYDLVSAAAALGVSVVTIRREIARRHLAYARIGRRVVIPEDALAEYLRARTTSLDTTLPKVQP